MQLAVKCVSHCASDNGLHSNECVVSVGNEVGLTTVTFELHDRYFARKRVEVCHNNFGICVQTCFIFSLLEAQWLLYIYRRLVGSKILPSARTVYSYVLHGSHNKLSVYCIN